jgi:hypothetical protein
MASKLVIVLLLALVAMATTIVVLQSLSAAKAGPYSNDAPEEHSIIIVNNLLGADSDTDLAADVPVALLTLDVDDNSPTVVKGIPMTIVLSTSEHNDMDKSYDIIPSVELIDTDATNLCLGDELTTPTKDMLLGVGGQLRPSSFKVQLGTVAQVFTCESGDFISKITVSLRDSADALDGTKALACSESINESVWKIETVKLKMKTLYGSVSYSDHVVVVA